jgi:hypothetical protein
MTTTVQTTPPTARASIAKESRDMKPQRIASRDDWLAARKWLLAKERELTHLRDEINAERRALPWVKVDKPYLFEGPNGSDSERPIGLCLSSRLAFRLTCPLASCE